MPVKRLSITRIGLVFLFPISLSSLGPAQTGTISTIAGNGQFGLSTNSGFATSMSLSNRRGVSIDAAGNLFIGDYGNDRIRKVDSGGIISTIAGTGQLGYSGDGGPAISAQIYYPVDVTVDADGNLYFADVGNNRIRKIQGPSAVTTYFSRIAVGGGYKTFIIVANTGSAECSANLVFTDSGGRPLIINAVVNNPSSGLQNLTDSFLLVVVPSGGVPFIEASGVDPNNLQVGWARLVSSEESLSSIATYEYKIDGIVKTMVAVLHSRPVHYATIPVDNDTSQKKQLAFAVANPSGQTVVVKLALVAPNGTVVDDSKTITLDPRKQVAVYLEQVTGSSNFRGSLVFRGKDGAAFVVLALLDKEGIYTMLPIASDKAPGIPE